MSQDRFKSDRNVSDAPHPLHRDTLERVRRLPPPLTPAGCDLRSLPYMPLEIDRLLNSDFNAIANSDEWRAGITLCCQAFRRVPAGSLPNTDAQLARLADLGRDVEHFRRLRANALRGWFECDDGNLYHPVIAEKVLDAWIERLVARKKGSAGNAKRWKSAGDLSDINEALEEALRLLFAINPGAKRLRELPSKIVKRSGSDGSRTSHKDTCWDRKVEGLPAVDPSQEGDHRSGEIVALPHARVRVREAG